MTTENPRVWFKSISLENVRSFGAKQTIYFTNDGTENGKAAQWNIILGDNGTGKTTVLKGLIIGFHGPIVYGKLDEDIYKKKALSRSLSLLPRMSLSLEKDEKNIFNFSVQIDHNKSNQPIISEGLPNNTRVEWLYFLKQNIDKIYAYGASRRIGEGGITEIDTSPFINLFNDSQNLINAEEWLIQSEYISLKEPKFKNRFTTVLKILKTLFRGEVSAIYIKTETGVAKVYFETHYGPVRLHELSLGYKTLIAWMVDFAKGLFDRYPDSPDPLAEPAICLVDEIDLHLHPKFQRNIIKFLTETFPNTQFIATAHSPLIVVAAEERPLDANIILLKRDGDQTVVVNNPVDVANWSVDQILNSDLFEQVATRSESLTRLRNERDSLLAKAKLTQKDNARLAELDKQIGFVPFGQDQAEIQAETIIQQLADVLRKQQQVP